MRLSTKGRYAVTAMLDLALNEQKDPVTLADISQCERISLSYLEQLFSRLRRNGLVMGIRGPGGGYRLARPANEVTIAEIISAVDEKVDATGCLGGRDCRDGNTCLTHELWCDLSKEIFSFLSGITLGDMVNRPEVRKIAEENGNRRLVAAARSAA
jgi:Rrf2 family iron-sulfur cluster assembly transcriptional regulator